MKVSKIKPIKALISVVIILGIFLLLFDLDCNIRYGINMFDYFELRSISNEELEKSLKGTNLVVGVDGVPPLEFNNGSAENNIGMLPDYIHSLSVSLGTEIRTIDEKGSTIIDSLKENKVTAAILSKNEAVDNGFYHTEPVITAKERVLVLNGSNYKKLSDLKGKVIVMMKKDMGASSYKENQSFFDGVKIIPMDNIYQCFALVNKGTAAGILCNDIESIYFAKVIYGPNSYRFVKGDLGETEYTIAVTDSNKNLIEYFDKGIVELKKDGVNVQIVEKWLGTYSPAFFTAAKLNAIYKIVLSILAIVVVFLIWNRSMSKTVASRTRELSEKQDELNSIINTINSGILVLSKDNTILECNKPIENLLCEPRDEIIGKNYKDISSLEPFVKGYNDGHLKNIGERYYYTYSQSFGEGNRSIIIDDYTVMYQTEKKERQESKMIALGQLVAGLAHEIRNPLGIIKSYVYLLKRKYDDNLSQTSLAAIESNSDRINEFVTNLLTFSRLSKSDYEETDIDELIRDIASSFIVENEDENIRIDVDGKKNIDENPWINKSVLKMILINLIQNSIDAYNEEAAVKYVDIGYLITSDELTLKVKDNGLGIPHEKIDEIFNPFFSTKVNGTGLGLYLISTEISNEGGTISVESKRNEGTEFTVILPNRKDV